MSRRLTAVLLPCLAVLASACTSHGRPAPAAASSTSGASPGPDVVQRLCDAAGQLMNLPVTPADVAVPSQFPAAPFGAPVARCGPIGGANGKASAIVWPDVVDGRLVGSTEAAKFGDQFEQDGFAASSHAGASTQDAINWEGIYTGPVTSASGSTHAGRVFVALSHQLRCIVVMWL